MGRDRSADRRPHWHKPGLGQVTQRCDLVRGFDREPLVELAAVQLVTDAEEVSAAKSNSPRLVHLVDGTDGAAWVIDLRVRAWLPKHLLPAQDTVQPIPTIRARKRFRLRVGQRYWRDPVPDDLVTTLQHPLKTVLKQGTERVRLSGFFSDWIGIRQGSLVLVLAIIGEGKEYAGKQSKPSPL